MSTTLTTPISAEDLENIRVGDVIFLDGHIVTWRQLNPTAKPPAGARVLTLAEVAAEITRLPAPPRREALS